MGNDENHDSGLDEKGPETMGPLAAPDPERASETSEEHDKQREDVREQIRATPNE